MGRMNKGEKKKKKKEKKKNTCIDLRWPRILTFMLFFVRVFVQKAKCYEHM